MSALFQPFPMLPRRRAQAWRHRPEFRRPRHFHDEPELNLVVSGTAVLGVGDRVETLSAGQALVFQPGQDHVLLQASDDLSLFVLALRPELAERVLDPRSVASSRSARFEAGELAGIADEFAALEEARDDGAVERRTADLFSRVLARRENYHVVSRHALEQARSDTTLGGKDVACAAGVAPSTLSTRFHRDLGLPLVEYRARLKLMRFVSLVDGGASQTRAALDAGFGSYAQCHRVFLRSLGCSPRRYFGGERARLDAALFGALRMPRKNEK